jgi:cell division protein FtsB
MAQLVDFDPLLVQPLRRPAERRRRKPPTPAVQARPAVVRTAVVIAVLGVTFAFAGRIAGIGAEPIMATYRTGQEIKGLQQTLAAKTAVNDRLRRDIAYLNTPEGVEQEARRRGWVKANEVSIAMVTADGEASAAPITAPVPKPVRPRSVADKLSAWVDTYLAVLGGRSPKPAATP